MDHADTPNELAKPLGRRPGRSNTRDPLLEAARTLFAEKGYEGASLREIAGAAGVDPGMIRHHFGDKETLFVTAMTEETGIPERLVGTLTGPPEGLGRRVTDTYLRLWEDPSTQPILTGLVRSAITSPRGAELLSKVLMGRAHREARIPLPEDQRSQGILLAASHLFGVAIARSVLKIPALAEMPHDQLVETIAPSIQGYLTGQQLTLGPRQNPRRLGAQVELP